jgi:hypothetical protein
MRVQQQTNQNKQQMNDQQRALMAFSTLFVPRFVVNLPLSKNNFLSI